MMAVIVDERADPTPADRNVSSRDRMIASAARLFREHGYSGTGFRDVVADSGAPRGSIYHHFPGGKAELAQETVRYAADVVAAVIDRAGDDPVAALQVTLAWWRATLEKTGYRAGCPVVAIAVEAHERPELLDAAADAFAQWERLLAGSLRGAGVARGRAGRLAALAVAAIEGAVVRCRAARDTRALDDVGRELEALFRGAASDG